MLALVPVLLAVGPAGTVSVVTPAEAVPIPAPVKKATAPAVRPIVRARQPSTRPSHFRSPAPRRERRCSSTKATPGRVQVRPEGRAAADTASATALLAREVEEQVGVLARILIGAQIVQLQCAGRRDALPVAHRDLLVGDYIGHPEVSRGCVRRSGLGRLARRDLMTGLACASGEGDVARDD